MNLLKRLMVLSITISLTIMPNLALANSAETSNPIKGSISLDITPYCKDWNSNQAFNIINHIGAKLISNNDIDTKIQFVVVDKEDANASTNINNQISVYSGLLKYVETEDELAYVIGHEMGHVEKSHVKKSFARNILTRTAGVAGSALVLVSWIKDSSKLAKTGTILAGSSVAGELVNKKLSRGQETKSDLVSIDYMVNAGYNPLASISMLNKISGNYFDFFSDHPSGEKRIKKAYNYIQEKYPEYIKKGYPTTSYKRALKIVQPE